MCAPSSSSVFASAMNFTKPVVSPTVRARPFAENGNLPTRYSRPLSFTSSLGESDGRDLGPGVHDAGHRLVVHVRPLARDHFGRDDALLLGLVREQLAADAVADREDVREIGAHLIVDENLAALADAETRAPRRRCR